MQKRLIVITGASKGIGAQIALETNKKFTDKDTQTTFLLIARDLAKLHEVKAELIKENSQNNVLTLSYDFSRVTNVETLTDILRNNLTDQNFDEMYVFYNHGTLKIAGVELVADDATNEFQINVISVWQLLAAIRRLFPNNIVPKQYHINISSLVATQMSKMCSVYSSTRIARATIFKCLAFEHPELRVLNYQPGPVYTNMLKQLYDDQVGIFDKSDSSFRDGYDSGNYLTAETTVKRMLDLIEKNSFENGSTIDYYDEI